MGLLSVKIPVADLTSSRAWYAEVFELTVELEWPDSDGVVRGVGFAPIGGVMIALREHPEAAAATKNFGFLNISVPREDDSPPARSTSTGWPSRTPRLSTAPPVG